MSNKKGFTSTILHSDRNLKPEFGALHQPVHTSVTWGYEDVKGLLDVFQNKAGGFAYSRQGNPTVIALEHKITQMEQGMATVAFSTGMAAITSVMLALVKAGDHIIASKFLFGNTRNILHTFSDMGVEISYVDATSVENVEAVYKENTRIVFVETIANPGTQIADLERIGSFSREKSILYIVDNTMSSPYLFRPVLVGAGLVINSLTKYIGGHGDALGGSVTDTGLFRWSDYANITETMRLQIKPELLGITQIRKRGLRDGGGTLSPEAAHSISVGSETIALRLDRICSNAMRVALFLQSLSGVKEVNYPGLVGHPEHTLASKLFKSYGGLMSFVLEEGIDSITFLNKLQLIIKSSNLGENRTLAIPVAQTIFHELGAARRAEMGIDESLIRLSVGIEDIQDLLDDLGQALA
ncbi:cystathionine gamma-synthase family protein [Dyadobacter sp. 3J3]|uniref:cystathionine gamma-synthase family protein n=1 Tax=Dyadobacter sp. 3J3 TaxID=2606600 RepID=UPI00135AF113|nr:cystathionine gamma-synthase family protein [Dyadobacter sp. 3J3]